MEASKVTISPETWRQHAKSVERVQQYSPIQTKIINYIQNQAYMKPITIRKVADGIGVKHATTSTNIYRMLNAGLLTRHGVGFNKNGQPKYAYIVSSPVKITRTTKKPSTYIGDVPGQVYAVPTKAEAMEAENTKKYRREVIKQIIIQSNAAIKKNELINMISDRLNMGRTNVIKELDILERAGYIRHTAVRRGLRVFATYVSTDDNATIITPTKPSVTAIKKTVSTIEPINKDTFTAATDKQPTKPRNQKRHKKTTRTDFNEIVGKNRDRLVEIAHLITKHGDPAPHSMVTNEASAMHKVTPRAISLWLKYYEPLGLYTINAGEQEYKTITLTDKGRRIVQDNYPQNNTTNVTPSLPTNTITPQPVVQNQTETFTVADISKLAKDFVWETGNESVKAFINYLNNKG